MGEGERRKGRLTSYNHPFRSDLSTDEPLNAPPLSEKNRPEKLALVFLGTFHDRNGRP